MTAARSRCSQPAVVTEAEYCEILGKEKEFEEEVHRLNEYGSAIADAYSKANSAEVLKLSLEPWRAYKLPIELTETECLSIRIGLMPLSTDVQEVENELEAAGLPSVVQCVNKDKEQMYG